MEPLPRRVSAIAFARRRPFRATAISTISTYCVFSNIANATITGHINSNMPSGATFTLTLDAPPGGISSGAKTITSSATTLVTSIDAGTASCSGVVHYSFAATTALGVVSGLRSLSLTLTTGGGG